MNHNAHAVIKVPALPAPEKDVVDGLKIAEEESKKLKFVHLRSKVDQDVAVTIGYIWDHEKGEVRYQVSRCGRGDKFCKRIGRSIASGRYRKYGPEYFLHGVRDSEDLIQQFVNLWDPSFETSFPLESE